MGAELLVAGIAIALSAASAAYGFLSASKQQQEKMKPNTVEDFSVTQAKEGTVVPIIYGKVRTEGNIIWWGNLETEEIPAESPAGKGMGGGDGGTSGFKYFADVQQGLCFVPSGSMTATITYVNDSVAELEAGSINFNDGNDSYFPTEPGGYSTKLPGVCFIFLKRWYIGDNVSSMPSVHWVLERTLPTTVNHANMENGNNPAAIVYDLLRAAGVTSGQIDLASFNAAADYWYAKGYGLNIKFTEQDDVDSLINRVMSFVDGTVYEDNQGKYAIRAFDPDDAPDATLTDDDYADFSITNPSWDDVHNDFRGTYSDEDQDFTKRIVSVQNPAVIEAVGYKKTQSVDLSAYRDAETAAALIYEIMKTNSFPAKKLSLRLHLKWSSLLPGDVISISHTLYGISSAEFRVKSISIAEIDSNEVSVEADQMVETLFDDTFSLASGNHFTRPELLPEELTHTAVFELPYNQFTGTNVALLILAAREHGNETGFEAWVSATEDGDYRKKGTFSGWSQRGVLAATYIAGTHRIDDTVGILYTPYLQDPQFDSISRQDLFLVQRFAIIGSEIIAFQVVTTEGSNIRLTGCVRGVLNTPIAEHTSGAEIWLVNLGSNILQGNFSETSYVQLVPKFREQSVEMPVEKLEVSITNKAKMPYKPGRVLATRTGSDVAIAIWPASPGIPGAGTEPPQSQTDQYPFQFSGDFWADYETGDEFFQNTEHEITKAGAFTLTVKSRLNGYLSSAYTIAVGASDGVYKGA